MGGAGDPGDARDMAQPGNWSAVRKNRRAGALPVRRRGGLRSEKHALSQITNHPQRNKNAPGVIFLYGGEIFPKFTAVARSNAPTKNMQTTTTTASSFQSAVLAVLATDSDRWPQPVIYAEEIDGEMRFGACNQPALSGDEIVWLYVDGDSFGELTGDHEADAVGIALNMYEQAVNDTLDEIERAEKFAN